MKILMILTTYKIIEKFISIMTL